MTYYAEQQTWGTPLLCYDQEMHVTHAKQHLEQVVTEILRPATIAISSNFLRKRALLWAKRKTIASPDGTLDFPTYAAAMWLTCRQRLGKPPPPATVEAEAPA